MQDAVAFVKPTGFFVDEIEEVATGLEAELLADGLLANGIKRAGAGGVDEGEFVGDLNLCCDGRDAKGDAEFHRDFGVDFDYVAPDGEAFGGEVETVEAEGQVLKNDVAVGGNLEAALKTVAFAEKFAASGESGALRIADFEMEFAAEALGACGDSRGQAEEAGQQGEADLRPLSVHCNKSMRYLALRFIVRGREYFQDSMRGGRG